MKDNKRYLNCKYLDAGMDGMLCSMSLCTTCKEFNGEKCSYYMPKTKMKDKDNVKYYKIYGYDSNFDLGGSHIQPLLCIVKARDKAQAEEYANTLPRYKDSWHGKGDVVEVKVIDLVGARK